MLQSETIATPTPPRNINHLYTEILHDRSRSLITFAYLFACGTAWERGVGVEVVAKILYATTPERFSR